MSNGRFTADQKRLINSQIDVNQLLPMKYRWAWEHYLNGNDNHWLPSEVPMGDDIALWRSNQLSEDERLVVLRNLGFFATAESLVANNAALAIYRHVTAAECRQYLIRQIAEEAIHTHTFLYICESLGLDQGEIFNMYNELPSIRAKKDFEVALTQKMFDPGLDLRRIPDGEAFLRNLVGYYVILEGIMFYSGFAMILSFLRQNRLRGIGTQFRYILRDETIHLNFGVDLINGIKQENPELWTPALRNQLLDDVQTGVALEIAYAQDVLPRGILGLNAGMFTEYVRHIADRRLERIGLPVQWKGAKNPFPWMSEMIDLKKETNFFEGRVTEYAKTGTLQDDL